MELPYTIRDEWSYLLPHPSFCSYYGNSTTAPWVAMEGFAVPTTAYLQNFTGEASRRMFRIWFLVVRYVNTTSTTLLPQQDFCNPYPSLTKYRRTSPWISLKDYPNHEVMTPSWWLWIDCPNVLIFCHYLIPSQPHKWCRYSFQRL